MYVIGLDVGTSGVKSTVFGENAQIVSHARREYDLLCGAPGQYELDPEVLLQKSVEALRESVAAVNGKEVRAICITSFGESFVCMDKDDRVLANTMIYMDRRGTQEIPEFLELADADEIYKTSGQFVDPMFGVYKLLWMQKHKPQLMERVRRISFIADFVAYKLGAEHTCDYSLAARSALFDIRKKTWWAGAMTHVGLRADILPQTVPSGSVTGTLNRKSADILGMDTSVKLIIGGHDQILAACGGGAFKPGDLVNGMGTVDCMTPILDINSVDTEKLMHFKLPLVPYLHTGAYVTYAISVSGGCIIKWFRDVLAKDVAGLSTAAYDILGTEAPEEPTSLLAIPYFAGGATPDMDDKTPATITGLRLGTTRGEIFRALMEGEAYEMRRCVDCIIDAGIDIRKITAVGGGANSSVWMQLRADIFERKLYTARNKEAGTLASALLCYANIGVYRDIREAQEHLVEIESVHLPEQKNSAAYVKKRKEYHRFYEAVKGGQPSYFPAGDAVI